MPKHERLIKFVNNRHIRSQLSAIINDYTKTFILLQLLLELV